MRVYAHTHAHTHIAHVVLDASRGVGTRPWHLEGPKKQGGLNVDVYVFVDVYKVHNFCWSELALPKPSRLWSGSITWLGYRTGPKPIWLRRQKLAPFGPTKSHCEVTLIWQGNFLARSSNRTEAYLASAAKACSNQITFRGQLFAEREERSGHERPCPGQRKLSFLARSCA